MSENIKKALNDELISLHKSVQKIETLMKEIEYSDKDFDYSSGDQETGDRISVAKYILDKLYHKWWRDY